jgi:hypothetical protein
MAKQRKIKLREGMNVRCLKEVTDNKIKLHLQIEVPSFVYGKKDADPLILQKAKEAALLCTDNFYEYLLEAIKKNLLGCYEMAHEEFCGEMGIVIAKRM